MKAFNILKRASLLLLLIPVLLFVTCNKDGNDPNPGSIYRIIKSNFSIEDILPAVNVIYEYQGDKMSLQHTYQDDHEVGRTQFEYPDNSTIESVFSDYHDSVWYEFEKIVYKLESNHVTELIGYMKEGGSWNQAGKETFRYENDNLVEYMSWSYTNNVLQHDIKVVWKYNGKLPVMINRQDYFLNEWQDNQKDTITYIENHMDTIYSYLYDDGMYNLVSKVGFTYEGDLIKKWAGYSNEEGHWEEYGPVAYTYDSYGNLTKAFSQDGNDSDTIEYFYEKGSGNYTQLYNIYGWALHMDIFPHPTKSAPIGKDFLLKGLHPDLVNSHFLK